MIDNNMPTIYFDLNFTQFMCQLLFNYTTNQKLAKISETELAYQNKNTRAIKVD